jgi:lipopolysaccharide heptosyltransferase II
MRSNGKVSAPADARLKRFKRGKLRIAVAIDVVMRTCFKIGRAFLFNGPSSQTIAATPQRILVLQTGGAGDVVMSLPALNAIRAHFPRAAMTLVAGPWATELLGGMSLVERVVGVRPPWLGRFSLAHWIRFLRQARQLRKEQFDLAIDLQGDPRSLLFLYMSGARRRVSYAWYGEPLGEYLLTEVVPGPEPDAHLIDRFLGVAASLGCQVGSRIPRLHLSDAERVTGIAWRRSLQARGNRLLLGVHPGAGNPLRLWRSERFADLVKQLRETLAADVVVFAGPGEEERAADILRRAGSGTLVSGLTLRDLVVRISALDGLIALDSSAAHVGAALEVPVVCLFGPTLPQFGGPIGHTVRSLQEGQFECRPCTQERCVHPEASCMDAITLDVVLKATVLTVANGVRANGAPSLPQIGSKDGRV